MSDIKSLVDDTISDLVDRRYDRILLLARTAPKEKLETIAISTANTDTPDERSPTHD